MVLRRARATRNVRRKPRRTIRRRPAARRRRGSRKRSIMPRRKFIVCKYRKDWEASTDRTSEVWNTTGLVTNGLTYPVASQPASMAFLGSHCLTPLGEQFIQYPSGADSFITEGFPLGITDYGIFYGKARVHASSIRIDVLPFASTATAYRYVLMPIPVPPCQVDPDGSPIGTQGNAYRPMNSTVKQQLDNMTYYELSSQPLAKWGTISAPNARTTIIKYKTMKTKTMLNLKDIADNPNFAMGLPQNDAGITISQPLYDATNNAGLFPNQTDSYKDYDTWIWYFRMFNLGQSGNDQSGLCSFSVSIKYFVELYDRAPLEMRFTQEWPAG